MLIEINPHNIDQRLIQEIVVKLQAGELIIFPTDTVYAIGCNLSNKKALEKLAKFKNVKLKKANFSIICEDISTISGYLKPIDRPTFKLLKQTLPGPFTYILHATNEVQKLFASKKKEIGIRIPGNNIILEIVKALGNPVATTSIHNEEDEIQDYFSDPYELYQRYDEQVGLVIDGGFGNLDPSTVVDCTDGITIVRQGIGKLPV